MEHLILHGGEEYLPLARKYVKKLSRGGGAYASQAYMVDDVVIRVRITPGHEFIDISEDPDFIEMENGVVDVLNIGELNGDTFKHGIILKTSAEAAYTAGYTGGFSGKWADWMMNKDAAPERQIAGTIALCGKKIVGRIRISNQSEAFAPGLEPASPQTDPPTYQPKARDEQLWAKKLAAILCPPSIFTGKTRLYVQALYGSRMYTYKDDRARTPGDEKSNVAFSLAFGGSLPPALVIRSLDGQSEVIVDTSSGVHLDNEGRHWLFVIGNASGNVISYPLTAPKRIERRRKLLSAASTALSAEDKKRLEAYILSVSKPDTKKKVVIGRAPTPMSIGYGWHWNEAGTEAAVVEVEKFDQDALNQGMRSRLHELKINATLLESGQRIFVSEHKAGAMSEWSLYRTYWTLLEPEWTSLMLTKTTPRRTLVRGGSGPFYVFYLGNVRQLCQLSVDLVAGSPVTRTMSTDPAYALSPVYGAAVDMITRGNNGGWLIDDQPAQDHFALTVKIGERQYGPSPVGRASTKTAYTQSGKANMGISDPRWSSEQGGLNPQTIMTDVGPVDVYSGIVYNTSFFYMQEFDVVVKTTHKSDLSHIAVVVPVNDAEAVYVRSQHVQYETTTEAASRMSAGVPSYTTLLAISSGGPWSYIPISGTGSAASSTPLSSSSTSRNVENHFANIKKLICKAGDIDCEFPGIGLIHSNELDEIPQSYATKGSFNGAVYAPGMISPLNAPANVQAPVFVGNA